MKVVRILDPYLCTVAAELTRLRATCTLSRQCPNPGLELPRTILAAGDHRYIDVFRSRSAHTRGRMIRLPSCCELMESW